jgi:hypothetical protein
MARRTLRLLAPAALLALAACSDRGAPPAPQAAARGGDRYTVRGEVVRVPQPGATERELSIRHEAIPEFKTASGTAVGMKPMVMPFSVAASVPLEGLAAGDKIRFRFVMDWKNNASEIEHVEKLPPETALDFGAR